MEIDTDTCWCDRFIRPTMLHPNSGWLAGSLRRTSPPFDGIRGVVEAITKEAFKLAGEAVTEVRVVGGSPEADIACHWLLGRCGNVGPTLHRDVPTKVFVKGLTLATIIGVKPTRARSETTGHHQYSIPRKTGRSFSSRLRRKSYRKYLGHVFHNFIINRGTHILYPITPTGYRGILSSHLEKFVHRNYPHGVPLIGCLSSGDGSSRKNQAPSLLRNPLE